MLKPDGGRQATVTEPDLCELFNRDQTVGRRRPKLSCHALKPEAFVDAFNTIEVDTDIRRAGRVRRVAAQFRTRSDAPASTDATAPHQRRKRS